MKTRSARSRSLASSASSWGSASESREFVHVVVDGQVSRQAGGESHRHRRIVPKDGIARALTSVAPASRAGPAPPPRASSQLLDAARPRESRHCEGWSTETSCLFQNWTGSSTKRRSKSLAARVIRCWGRCHTKSQRRCEKQTRSGLLLSGPFELSMSDIVGPQP